MARRDPSSCGGWLRCQFCDVCTRAPPSVHHFLCFLGRLRKTDTPQLPVGKNTARSSTGEPPPPLSSADSLPLGCALGGHHGGPLPGRLVLGRATPRTSPACKPRAQDLCCSRRGTALPPPPSGSASGDSSRQHSLAAGKFRVGGTGTALLVLRGSVLALSAGLRKEGEVLPAAETSVHGPSRGTSVWLRRSWLKRISRLVLLRL